MTQFSNVCADVGIVDSVELYTRAGSLPASHLYAGDEIISRDAGFARVQRISTSQGRRRLVRVERGAFGNGVPHSDTLLAEDQLVHVPGPLTKSGHLANSLQCRAVDLVDAGLATHEEICDVRLVHIYCGGPKILYCNGLEIIGGDAIIPERRRQFSR
ncbi:Hint domain-containing protein [Sagittula sp. SSi028]|uniref:Hint domain-containing protein n=1 Tax=Sagittula sp. SSi028 TaxID=3400636 RepID=UPI003AF76FE4